MNCEVQRLLTETSVGESHNEGRSHTMSNKDEITIVYHDRALEPNGHGITHTVNRDFTEIFSKGSRSALNNQTHESIWGV